MVLYNTVIHTFLKEMEVHVDTCTHAFCENIYSEFLIQQTILSAECQKGINTVQWCSIENQKGAIVIDFVQQYRPIGYQQNIFEQH